MELLIAILMWLGLITSGSTYTVDEIRQIESANAGLIATKQSEFDKSQANATAPPSTIDLKIIGIR